MKIFFAAMGLGCFWVTLLAQDASQKQQSRTPFMMSSTDLEWVELPERKGVQFAILAGDPQTGAYTQMRKVPAGTDNELHSHSSEIKNVVISGIWYTGPNAATARDFGPGSVIIMPANWIHVSGCLALEPIASFIKKAKVSSTSSRRQSNLATNNPIKSRVAFALFARHHWRCASCHQVFRSRPTAKT
jgi:quercetin dioxygenase-like cupin family protein